MSPAIASYVETRREMLAYSIDEFFSTHRSEPCEAGRPVRCDLMR